MFPKMRHKVVVFLLIIVLCCEFSEESLQGPPAEQKRKDGDDEAEKDKSEEFISSIKDEEGASALKVVSAPDLTKESEYKKGAAIV